MTAMLACAIVFIIPAPKAVDMDRMCVAIEEKENGKWDSPGGRAQWTIEAWREELPLVPYRLASNKAQSRIAMKLRLARFAAMLTRAGVTVTVWQLASCWHYGFFGATHRSRTYQDFGELTEGIYEATK